MIKKVFLILITTFVFFSCKGAVGGGDSYNSLSNLKYDGKILQDGEDSKVVMDNNLRWWKLTEPVRVETNNFSNSNGRLAEVTDNQIRITSYSLYAIKNVDVYGNGTKLFTIPNLPALAEQVYDLPGGKKTQSTPHTALKAMTHIIRK